MLSIILLLRILDFCYAQEQLFVYPNIVEERTTTKTLVLRLNDELILNLERSFVMADNLLFVTRSSTGHHHKIIDTTRIQENLYHDSHQQSSLYVIRKDGSLQVEGIINSKLRIKPLLQSERSSEGQVLHSIYEAEEIRRDLKKVMYQHSVSGTPQNWMHTFQYPTTRAPRHVPKFVAELHIISDEGHQASFRREQDLIVYLAVMLNAVNRIFIDMRDPSISFKLVGITRSTNDSFASHILGTREAFETLERLVNYTRDHNILERSDLVYLITSGDLARLRNETTLDKGVAGLAYVGTVCTHSAVAEGEDIAKSYAGVHTMAHELAHSLGAKHDPQDNSGCSWSKGFLMSYEDKGSTKFRLSTCSQQNITNVVQRLSDECLNETASKIQNVSDTQMPGDMIVRHYYCRRILGENSRGYFRFAKDPQNECKLQCYYHKQNGTYTQTWYMTVDMPEGMWCGGEKTCQRGICTEEAVTKT
ncbi:venom metalloproteinase antarease-like TtrivMP_A isoform X1 [Dermacentor andersoni]|uniref:venom metalloproteinase antarease-like TtrivMP_A isoform X1 n=1 Tax=Dermacentor andersoni TaxID=34620 RepID=UPI003B3B1868